jgi:hypothetical protein
MIADLETAAQVKESVMHAYGQMEECMKLVELKCSPEEYAAFKRAVGKVVSTMLFEIIEPMYKANPTLKPPGWDD